MYWGDPISLNRMCYRSQPSYSKWLPHFRKVAGKLCPNSGHSDIRIILQCQMNSLLLNTYKNVWVMVKLFVLYWCCVTQTPHSISQSSLCYYGGVCNIAWLCNIIVSDDLIGYARFWQLSTTAPVKVWHVEAMSRRGQSCPGMPLPELQTPRVIFQEQVSIFHVCMTSLETFSIQDNGTPHSHTPNTIYCQVLASDLLRLTTHNALHLSSKVFILDVSFVWQVLCLLGLQSWCMEWRSQ